MDSFFKKMLHWYQNDVNSWHQLTIKHRSKMKVFVTSTVNIKTRQPLASNWCCTLTFKKHFIQNCFSNKICFQHFVLQWPFLDTFFTSYWPHLFIWYLQFDISRMSQSGQLMLCHDTEQLLTSISSMSAHWDVYVIFNLLVKLIGIITLVSEYTLWAVTIDTMWLCFTIFV